MKPLHLALYLVLGGAPLFAQNALLDSIQVMGGSASDSVVSITPDDAGNLFVLGTTMSPDFPATATFGTKASGSFTDGDTFVAKIHLADWSLTWSVVIRPSVPFALAIDHAGAVYLTGRTDSAVNFPTTPGAFATSVNGSLRLLFVLKLDSAGSRILYSSLLASNLSTSGAGLAVDSQGQAYIAAGGSAPITPGALFPAITTGDSGAFLAKLSDDGSKVISCTYLATSATLAPRAVVVDDQQNVFVAGGASEHLSAFPSTAGVVQPKHGGSSDAFVMKFRADFSKLEFATLLGGGGGDSATFLRVAPDGSIYLAGACESGTFSADAPFPTTANAPFRATGLFNGFVARLSSDASSIFFSTYISNAMNAGVSGFALAGGQVFAGYYITLSRGFLGFNYYPTADQQSTAVQTFDAVTGAAGPVLQIPALTPAGFAVSDGNLVIASNGSQISRPVPSTIKPIGPLDAASTGAPMPDIVFGKFDLTGTPDHDIDTDRGYVYLDSYPGATVEQTLSITSSSGSVPFQFFVPSTAATLSQRDGFTPAAVSVTPGTSTPGSIPALLLVSPRALPSIQILPIVTYNRNIQSFVPAVRIMLPTDGGLGTGTINVTANAVSPLTQESVPVSVPFQFNSVPPVLTLDPLKGMTPANITITGKVDSFGPGGTDIEQLNVVVNGRRQSVSVFLSRPSPPPLITMTSAELNGQLGQATASMNLQVTPPDDTTMFQAFALPAGITVTPSSGTGPAVVTVTADLTQFPVGSSRINFTIQVGTTEVPVTAYVVIHNPSISIGQPALGLSPGTRLKISVSANLPNTGAWTEASPAPTDWNGYSFVYRAHNLPILSADPSKLEFDVQLPYDLDITASNTPILFLAPDGTEIARGVTYGAGMPTAIGSFDTGGGSYGPFKADGSAISPSNTVVPGDSIRLYVVGAGVTNPSMVAGVLPDADTTVSPATPIQVQIVGKNAIVLRQALDPNFIGVVDVDIRVPNVAAGLEMLGLQSGSAFAGGIKVWIVN